MKTLFILLLLLVGCSKDNKNEITLNEMSFVCDDYSRHIKQIAKDTKSNINSQIHRKKLKELYVGSWQI